ncbi:MAG: hypothetical protein GF341_10045 [candidate division Zixibacteria bacterium]|nr:hypothetical protein [candidate division Zixibacteria bacterium]
MTTLAFALMTARRAWYVPDVTVTGDYSAMTVEMLVSEADDSEGRVVLYRYPVGGMVQEVIFHSLVDHRGNTLPATINQPVVIPIPRNDVPVAVVGQPSAASCRLARTSYVAHNGLVDLWIVEAGREGE